MSTSSANGTSDTILVTGGAGYIGSHTVVELLNAGKKVVVIDNFANSSLESINRIEAISGKRPAFHQVDITDYTALHYVFQQHKIDSVIHFAALKAVGESAVIPLEYYRVNIGGTITLLRAMSDNGVKSIVFSSSATVYGDATRFPNMIPIPEDCPAGPTNPYGRSKMATEMVIQDHCAANPDWSAALLRYFNPGGAHPSGLLGEDPLGVPNNLLPYAAQVAVGRRPFLSVFGDDYDTKDGTPIRDYIHVGDLAVAHLKACEKIQQGQRGWRAWNIGTGHGSTVLEVVDSFSRAVGHKINVQIAPRRAGDVLNLTAKVDLAESELGFKTKFTLQDICDDTWRFIAKNPKGMNPDKHAGSPGMMPTEYIRQKDDTKLPGEEHSKCFICGK